MRNAPVVSGTSTTAANMDTRTRVIGPRGSCVTSKSLVHCSSKMAPRESLQGRSTETLESSGSCLRTFNAPGRHVSSVYMQNTTPADSPSVQRCLRCARELTELDPRPQCPYCGGLLELRHAAPAERGAALASRFRTSKSPSGVWRFGPMVLPGGADAAVTWPEGNTPLICLLYTSPSP